MTTKAPPKLRSPALAKLEAEASYAEVTMRQQLANEDAFAMRVLMAQAMYEALREVHGDEDERTDKALHAWAKLGLETDQEITRGDAMRPKALNAFRAWHVATLRAALLN